MGTASAVCFFFSSASAIAFFSASRSAIFFFSRLASSASSSFAALSLDRMPCAHELVYIRDSSSCGSPAWPAAPPLR